VLAKDDFVRKQGFLAVSIAREKGNYLTRIKGDMCGNFGENNFIPQPGFYVSCVLSV
jgi:hypothetical protein